jgi:hypothetical protein
MKRSVYTRPNKPMTLHVRDRNEPEAPTLAPLPEPVAVDAATECHVTPADVAARMVRALGPTGDYLTLEPSAGTGSLVRALLDSGHSRYEITAIERHASLAATVRPLAPTLNRCFLEYAEEARGKIEFPRVLMNPPFRKLRHHINAALSLLGRGGHSEPAKLVALVPITFEHPEAEEIDRLPVDTFELAKVHTKIIRICR